MSATLMSVSPIAFGNPDWSNGSLDSQSVPANESHSVNAITNIVTISTNAADAGQAITGLLYVPDIAEGNPCYEASLPYVPVNATRQRNLPAGDFFHVAIAPWLGPDCVEQYLASARMEPTHAFLTFIPDTGVDNPPDSKSSTWLLNDGGEWRDGYLFPVYGIQASVAQTILKYSAQYSGNMTDVPFGSSLTESLDPRDYVRLFVTIDTAASDSLPSLWIFLLAVLAILLLVIGTTSCTMHFVQRRRREILRRRVASGEVDLEALGIKRLTVPQRLLDEMPLYPYGADTHSAMQADSKSTTDKTPIQVATLVESYHPTLLRGQARSISFHPSPLHQPTCAICLEDFTAASATSEGTIVRELPCHHIFHPECVDTFLRDNSSLCPMCKKTALPQGYCPRTITNAMVRRERLVRRLRPEAQGDEDADQVSPLQALRRHTLSSIGQFRRHSTASLPSAPAGSNEAMTNITVPPIASVSGADEHTPASPTSATPRTVQPSANQSRREWARQRAVAMLGPRHQQTPVDPDAEEAARIPRWRKTLQGVFPGLGIRDGAT